MLGHSRGRCGGRGATSGWGREVEGPIEADLPVLWELGVRVIVGAL